MFIFDKFNVMIHWLNSYVKGMSLSKALTCMNFSCKTNMTFLSRRRIPLAILLYEHFVHLIQITLRPNTQLLSNKQHAYQPFFESLPGSILFAILWHTG